MQKYCKWISTFQYKCKIIAKFYFLYSSKNLQSGANKMQLHDTYLQSKIYFPRQLQKLCTIFLGNVLIWNFFPWKVLFRNVNSEFRLDSNMKQKNQCFSKWLEQTLHNLSLVFKEFTEVSMINKCHYFCWIFIDFHWQITGNDDRRRIPNQNRAKMTGNNCNLSIKTY